MADPLLRYTGETFRAYARRLASLELNTFDAAKCLATGIEEDFSGTQRAARKHFIVEVRNDHELVVRCRSDRAENWLRKRLQRGKTGELNAFAGRAVLLERPLPPPELPLGAADESATRRPAPPPIPSDLDRTTCLYCGRKARAVLVAGEPRCDLHYDAGNKGRLPASVMVAVRASRRTGARCG